MGDFKAEDAFRRQGHEEDGVPQSQVTLGDLWVQWGPRKGERSDATAGRMPRGQGSTALDRRKTTRVRSCRSVQLASAPMLLSDTSPLAPVSTYSLLLRSPLPHTEEEETEAPMHLGSEGEAGI